MNIPHNSQVKSNASDNRLKQNPSNQRENPKKKSRWHFSTSVHIYLNKDKDRAQNFNTDIWHHVYYIDMLVKRWTTFVYILYRSRDNCVLPGRPMQKS